jgi:plastocyanin
LDFPVEQLISFIIRNYYKRLYMKKQYFLPLLVIGALAVALASHCSKGSSDGSSMNNNTGGNNNTVTMQNMSFSITSLTVKAGTTVTWTNNDNTTHTVTADNDSFNSGDITAGHSFTKTFNAQGTFPYHCIYHSTMKATVIVN